MPDSHNQDGGQGGEDGQGTEGHGLAGGVNRLGHRGDDRLAVTRFGAPAI